MLRGDDGSCSFKRTALSIFCKRPCNPSASKSAGPRASDANGISPTSANGSRLSLLPDFISNLRAPDDNLAGQERGQRAVRFSEPLGQYHFFEPDPEVTERGRCLRRIPGRLDLSLESNCTPWLASQESSASVLIADHGTFQAPIERARNTTGPSSPLIAGLHPAGLMHSNHENNEIDDMLYGNARLVNLRRLGGSFTIRNSPQKRGPFPPESSSSLRDFDIFQRRTKKFMQSLCIVDLQLPDRPISVTSRDLVPREPLSSGECLYLDDYLEGEDWTIHNSTSGDTRQAHYLLLKYTMSNCMDDGVTCRQTAKNSGYCMYAQVDITEVAEDTILDLWAEDVWLKIAADEMGRQESSFWGHISLFHQPPLARDELWDVVGRIRSFYQLYFMLSPQTTTYTSYKITYVSASLLQFGNDYVYKVTNVIHEKQQIGLLLQRGERFFFDARRYLDEPRQVICCVPMFGPALSCWLCFLISGTLFEQCAQRTRNRRFKSD